MSANDPPTLTAGHEVLHAKDLTGYQRRLSRPRASPLTGASLPGSLESQNERRRKLGMRANDSRGIWLILTT